MITQKKSPGLPKKSLKLLFAQPKMHYTRTPNFTFSAHDQILSQKKPRQTGHETFLLF